MNNEVMNMKVNGRRAEDIEREIAEENIDEFDQGEREYTRDELKNMLDMLYEYLIMEEDITKRQQIKEDIDIISDLLGE